MNKVFDKFMNCFEESYPCNILAWISRVISFPILIVIFNIMGMQTNLAFIVFAFLIIFLEWNFLIFGIKESNFKSDNFFKKLKTTKCTYDRFCRNRLIIKTSLFALFVLVPSAFAVYFVVSYITISFLAYRTIFKDFDFSNRATNRSFQSIFSMNNNYSGAEYVSSDEDSRTKSGFDEHAYFSDISMDSSHDFITDPPNYGTAGFDTAGIYTGSSSAIGGISN